MFLMGNSQEDVGRARVLEETLAPFKPNEANDGLRNLGMANMTGDDTELPECSSYAMRSLHRARVCVMGDGSEACAPSPNARRLHGSLGI